MGWFAKFFGVGGDTVAKPVEAVGNVLDKLFTSDDEKLDKKIILERLAMQPGLAQVELNKVEAAHRTVFVAGWRPYIGWVAGTSLGIYFIPQYSMATYMWVKLCLKTGELVPYPVTADGLLELVFAMLGMAGLRTLEKAKGVAK